MFINKCFCFYIFHSRQNDQLKTAETYKFFFVSWDPADLLSCLIGGSIRPYNIFKSTIRANRLFFNRGQTLKVIAIRNHPISKIM